jgi:hypothetical protein
MYANLQIHTFLEEIVNAPIPQDKRTTVVSDDISDSEEFKVPTELP